MEISQIVLVSLSVILYRVFPENYFGKPDINALELLPPTHTDNHMQNLKASRVDI